METQSTEHIDFEREDGLDGVYGDELVQEEAFVPALLQDC
jgi:hypothetical protein